MTAMPTIAFHIEFDSRGRRVYVLHNSLTYHSPRYGRTATVPCGYRSDGASGPARDIASAAWWVHDYLCDQSRWDDGTLTTPWQRSAVLSDILRAEGHYVSAVTWRWATLVYEWCLR